MPHTKLPLGTAVSYRGMTGRDEDILTDRKKLQNGDAIDEIMANCTLAMGTVDAETGAFAAEKETIQPADILRLKTPDRTSLLMAIRRESFGDELDIEIQCDSCNAKVAAQVDLSKLEEKPLPVEYNEEFGFERKLSSGTTIQFDYMNGNREKQLAKMTGNLVTMSMLGRLGYVEGVDKGDRKNWLLNLPVRLRNEIRKLMAETECGVETDASVDCTSCGTEIHFNVQGQQGFFFPAM